MHVAEVPVLQIALAAPSPDVTSLATIVSTLRAKHPLVCAYSGGKDSSCLANLAFTASKLLAAEGIRTPIIITHSDTRVENPEIKQLALSEIARMKAYAAKYDLDIRVMIGMPSISQAWAVRVIGGRALPPFPSTRGDCSSDWKVKPGERTVAAALAALKAQGWEHPVVCTGVRKGESIKRNTAIANRGERGDRIWINESGRAMLSPILEWTTDDVFEYLGMCNAGVFESYSNFEDVLQAYRSAGGTSCVVVSDMALAKFAKPCSARFGCWSCTRVGQDKSLRNMIESDVERYGYMAPLAALRDFIALTQHDWSRRQFVQRTIKDGYITIRADTYSPDMLAELLRYTLTAQVESGVSIIDEATLITIDARWSLYGLHAPFEAVRIWMDVMWKGNRYHPPKFDSAKPFPATPVPELGRIWVGKDWDDDASPLYAEGLRHPVWEMFSDSCGPSLRTYRNGKVGLDLDEALEVDAEGAAMFFDFEAERKANEPITASTLWTSGYMYYTTLGVVMPAKGQTSKVDNLLRRTGWRQRMNLHGQRSMDELRARCAVSRPPVEVPLAPPAQGEQFALFA